MIVAWRKYTPKTGTPMQAIPSLTRARIDPNQGSVKEAGSNRTPPLDGCPARRLMAALFLASRQPFTWRALLCEFMKLFSLASCYGNNGTNGYKQNRMIGAQI